MSNLTKVALRGLSWNYLGVITRSGSNFVIGILLARLLGPKPFGELAAALFVVGIANLIADAGFTSALVQTPSLSELQVRYVFTVQLLIAFGMTALCAAIAPLVAYSFHDPLVRGVLVAISPLFVLQALGQTANALLRRELRFKALQVAQLISYFVSYLLLGIPLAMHGAGVWSLVIAQLAQSALFAILLYWKVRHPLRFTLDASGGVLLRFGAKVLSSNIINYGISNADNFFVGSAFGSTALGYYNRAFSLANQPAETIVGTLQQVLFASCSRADGRREPVRRAYLACLSGVAFVTVPVFWGLAGSARTLMVALYGRQWSPAAPLLRPLLIALSMHALMAMAGPVLSSLNLVQQEIKTQAISLVIAISTFAIAAHFSPLVLAWSVCGVYVARCAVVTFPLRDALAIKLSDVISAVGGPLLLGALAFAVASGLDSGMSYRGMSPAVSLSVAAAGTAIALAVALLVAGRQLLPAFLGAFILQTAPTVARRISWLLPLQT